MKRRSGWRASDHADPMPRPNVLAQVVGRLGRILLATACGRASQHHASCLYEGLSIQRF